MVKETSDDILDLIEKCSGIITEMGGKNSHAAMLVMFIDKPGGVGVKNATSLFRDGTNVNVNAQTGRITEHNSN